MLFLTKQHGEIPGKFRGKGIYLKERQVLPSSTGDSKKHVYWMNLELDSNAGSCTCNLYGASLCLIVLRFQAVESGLNLGCNIF